MTKLINVLKGISNWFSGNASKLEQLDAEVKTEVNAATRKAFIFGAVVGTVVVLVVINL